MSNKKQIIRVIKLSSIDKFFTTANIVLVVYSTIKGIEYGIATYNSLKENALYKEYIKKFKPLCNIEIISIFRYNYNVK